MNVFLQVFTESTHIVAVRTSGNVYAWEAVQELNIKPKFMKDLMTDQPFTRKDIIHIQDPMNLEASALLASGSEPGYQYLVDSLFWQLGSVYIHRVHADLHIAHTF